VILLFEAGLSTDIKEFAKAGGWATAVAFIGVFFPFLFGFFIFRAFNLDINNAIFAGAVLTATSVGITARVFLDLKKLDTEEAKIVLGAAVIDDVIGLTILAVVSKLVTGGSVTAISVLQISGIAVLFLVIVVTLGLLIVPLILKYADKMKQDSILFLTAVIVCLLVAALSLKVGLAPIVGAFAIGLVMSNTKHVDEIKKGIKPIYALLVPVFFVLMGAKVDIGIFNPATPGNLQVLALGGILFVAAYIGKALAGFAVFKKGINKLLIGTAMVPRGEVGLIFASMGLTMGVFAQNIYSALVVVIMLTTFVTPVVLKILLSKPK
jgi:Kef-type K+ transport system membrane component KefB